MGHSIRRFLAGVGLSLALLLVRPVTARATFVWDPGQTLSALYNALEQLNQTMENLGVAQDQLFDFRGMKDWIDRSFGEGSTFKQLYDTYQNAKLMKSYMDQLKSMAKATQHYTDYLKNNWAGDYFNPDGVTRLINHLSMMGNTFNSMMELFETMMMDNGLTRGEKIQQVEKMTEELNQQCYHQTREFEEYLLWLEQSKAAVSAINFLTGNSDLTDGLAYVGATSEASAESVETPASDDFTTVAEGSVGVDKIITGSDYTNLSTGTKNLFSIITILFGMLSALSLVTAYIRYARGDYGAERIFVRIGVAGVFVTILLSALSKFIGFGF